MSRLAGMTTRIYGLFLRLYPKPFQMAFADEMQEVFAQELQESIEDGIASLLGMFYRELADLPVALVMEHIHQRRKDVIKLLAFRTRRDLQSIRTLARTFSLIVGGFFVAILVFNEGVRSEPTLAFLLHGVVTLCLLSAWRWEQIGGMLSLIGSPLLLTAYIFNGLREGIGLGETIWVSIALAGPYLILGWLFVSLAGHEAVHKAPQPIEDQKPCGAISRRAAMFIGAISLLMLLLLALSFMGPVSKESRVISQEGAKPSVGPGTPEVVFESSSMDGLQDLIRRLQATGVEVVRHESVEQPFFSVPGEIITLNFESVQIFDFGSSDKAEAEAANVLPDGRTFRSPNLKLNWSATPYFYLSGRLIVLYVGEDEEVMDILEILLGEPFAGGGGSTSN